MKFEKSSIEILNKLDGLSIVQHLERCIRTAYKSEDKIDEMSYKKIINKIMSLQHLSVLEHFTFSVRVKTAISVTREWNRHRLLSITEQSTRYCNYSKDKFGGVTFIQPALHDSWTAKQQEIFKEFCNVAEHGYLKALDSGLKPQQARALLPLCTKTEVIYTGNLREWRHVLNLRTDKSAHPDIRELTTELLKKLKSEIPLIFDDILQEN
ncbi:MAG: FAD-dependent thymidylate synthase [Candidatus Heimdallarchaeaceae archaeon]